MYTLQEYTAITFTVIHLKSSLTCYKRGCSTKGVIKELIDNN